MQTLRKYAENTWVIDYDQKFCPTCDEFITTVIEVETFVDEDGAVDYDDTVGKPFCPECETEDLYIDPADLREAVLEDYRITRAEYERTGEW